MDWFNGLNDIIDGFIHVTNVVEGLVAWGAFLTWGGKCALKIANRVSKLFRRSRRKLK